MQTECTINFFQNSTKDRMTSFDIYVAVKQQNKAKSEFQRKQHNYPNITSYGTFLKSTMEIPGKCERSVQT